MDREAWCTAVYVVTKSRQTRQSNWTELKALNLPTSSDSCLLLRPFSPYVQSCWSSLLLEHDRLGPFSWPLHLWYFPLGVLSLLIFAWQIPSHYVSLNSHLNFWGRLTLTIWCEELTHLKRPWCWERWKAGGEGDDRGRDGWMASLIQ